MKKVILGLMLAIGMTAVMSCEKEEIVSSDSQEIVDDGDYDFIESSKAPSNYPNATIKVNTEYGTTGISGPSMTFTNLYSNTSTPSGMIVWVEDEIGWWFDPSNQDTGGTAKGIGSKIKPVGAGGIMIVTTTLVENDGTKTTEYFEQTMSNNQLTSGLDLYFCTIAGIVNY